MYSLTLQPPTAATQAILGQFGGTKEQHIITASGSRLTLHRPDSTLGKVVPVFSHDVFGIIRTMAAFRLAGSNKGTLVVFARAGQVVIVSKRAISSPSRSTRLGVECCLEATFISHRAGASVKLC